MNERRLQAYASLAEVVSALAIIISLLYAGYEFRRSNTMSSREADVLLYERVREANRLMIETPGLAEILVEAQTAPEDLSAAERVRFLAFQHSFFDSWELGWNQHDDGILDETTWREWDDWFVQEARRRPSFAWTDNEHNFTGEAFRRHVEAALSAN